VELKPHTFFIWAFPLGCFFPDCKDSHWTWIALTAGPDTLENSFLRLPEIKRLFVVSQAYSRGAVSTEICLLTCHDERMGTIERLRLDTPMNLDSDLVNGKRSCLYLDSHCWTYQGKQCTYNVISRRVRVNIVAVGISAYRSFATIESQLKNLAFLSYWYRKKRLQMHF
jgi:hypothetical protein